MFTLKIWKNSVKCNHYVGTFKTRDAALKKAKFFIADGLKGAEYFLNNKSLHAELGL